MNIVFVSAEVAPWSKTGGLGDVLSGLPAALAARGHRVMTVAPRYDQVRDICGTRICAVVVRDPLAIVDADGWPQADARLLLLRFLPPVP